MSQACNDTDCVQRQGFWQRLTKSGLLVDNRWYCSDSCVRAAVERVAVRLVEELEVESPLRRSRLGGILLEKGLIQRPELDEVLRRQAEEGGSLGRWLVQLGYLAQKDLVAALSQQQGIPWIDYREPVFDQAALAAIPRRVCLELSLAPLELNDKTSTLVLGGAGPLEMRSVHMLRRMLGFDVRVFIIPDQTVEEVLKRHVEPFTDLHSEEAVVNEMEPGAVADLVLEWCRGHKAQRIRLGQLGTLFWARLRAGGESRHLFLVRGRAKAAHLARKQLPDHPITQRANGAQGPLETGI